MQLREQIARQIAAEVGRRKLAEQTLPLIARAQYRHLVLQRIRQGTVAQSSNAGVTTCRQSTLHQECEMHARRKPLRTSGLVKCGG